MKIHVIKSLYSHPSEVGLGLLVEDIIDSLDQQSMNHLPHEVKIFVKNCDTPTNRYNQRTLIGAADSMLGFSVKNFEHMNIDNYQFNLEWEAWIACQQKKLNLNLLDNEEDRYDNNCTPRDNAEDEYDNNNDWYYYNYISRGLCGTGPVKQQDFTIHDAVNIGLTPNYNYDGRGCSICPLGCLYVPASHPRREEYHEALLTIANKGSHPIYVNLPFFELSPWKIDTIKRMYKEGQSNPD